jgi:uncharacterized protein (TIGR03118 family)
MTSSAPFRPFGSLLAAGVAVGALCAGTQSAAAADPFTQTNLVSDLSGLAKLTDPQLVNPWGVSFIGPAPPAPFSSPLWISNNGKNNTTLYAVTDTTDVTKIPINPPNGFVAIPTTAAGPQGPTGQVSNTGSSFGVGNGGNGMPARFIFANLNGTISAWNGGASAITQLTTSGAVYTGLAKNTAQNMLYAANDSAGTIDVFDSSFMPASLPGAFATPPAVLALGHTLGVDFVPFNVQDLAGNVFVTYAPSGHPAQTSATAGEGAVAWFSESGVLENTIVGGPLASPWGMAIAPKGFGKFGGDLMVGNFSYADGEEINAFNLTTGLLVGTIDINIGANKPGGLWDLTFGGGGVGGNNGNPLALYFTDGINGEKDGLFGVISVPEPSTWAMMLLGFVGLGFAGYRASRKAAATTAA